MGDGPALSAHVVVEHSPAFVRRAPCSLQRSRPRRLAVPLVVGPGVIPLDYRAAQSEIDPGAEDELLALLNQVRAEYHLPPLVMDPMLRAAARAHSRDMALHGYL